MCANDMEQQNVCLHQKYDKIPKYLPITPVTNVLGMLSSPENTAQSLTTNHNEQRCHALKNMTSVKKVYVLWSIHYSQSIKKSINLLIDQFQKILCNFP